MATPTPYLKGSFEKEFIMQKIMIIEDDPAVRRELSLLLENERYQVLAVSDFMDILSQFQTFDPDLVLLDLGLPDEDGFTLCMKLRNISRVPIIFITARDSSMDELQALNLGGDDYITKPYNIPVLLARIKTVLRRAAGSQEPDRMEARGLSISLSGGIACAGGQTIELTRNELRILAHLMQHPGEIVSRTELIDILWDNHIYIDDNTLSVNITRLRGKLEEIGLPDYIKTRRGMGYQI